MGGSNRVYLEAKARVLPMAKRRWYSSSSFLSFLSFFSLVRFPLKQKPKGRTMKMKGTRFLFPFGNNEKNRGDKARGGIC